MKKPPVTAAQWAHAREIGFAVAEGTAGRTEAVALGEGGVEAAARAPSRGATAGTETEKMLERASGFVARQLSRLMASAERSGGRLDKAQVDALTALARMMERWEALVKEQAGQNEKRSEDELAAILDRIDARIVELARAEAKRLGAAKRARRAGRSGRS